MDDQTFPQRTASVAAFHAWFAPLFGPKDMQRRSAQYQCGLLIIHAEQRNVENIAGIAGGASPRALQRLLTDAPWSHPLVIAALQSFLDPRRTDPHGVRVVDDASCARQRRRLVAVARQNSNTPGSVGNRQISVGCCRHMLVDMRLSPPQAWIGARQRRAAASAPPTVTCQSAPDLAPALRMRRPRLNVSLSY